MKSSILHIFNQVNKHRHTRVCLLLINLLENAQYTTFASFLNYDEWK